MNQHGKAARHRSPSPARHQGMAKQLPPAVAPTVARAKKKPVIPQPFSVRRWTRRGCCRPVPAERRAPPGACLNTCSNAFGTTRGPAARSTRTRRSICKSRAFESSSSQSKFGFARSKFRRSAPKSICPKDACCHAARGARKRSSGAISPVTFRPARARTCRTRARHSTKPNRNTVNAECCPSGVQRARRLAVAARVRNPPW